PVSTDRAKLSGISKRRVASAELDRCRRAKMCRNRADPPEDFGQRKILDPLRAFREIAQGAVEVAPLRDLQRDAANRAAASEDLVVLEEASHATPGALQSL